MLFARGRKGPKGNGQLPPAPAPGIGAGAWPGGRSNKKKGSKKQTGGGGKDQKKYPLSWHPASQGSLDFFLAGGKKFFCGMEMVAKKEKEKKQGMPAENRAGKWGGGGGGGKTAPRDPRGRG